MTVYTCAAEGGGKNRGCRAQKNGLEDQTRCIALKTMPPAPFHVLADAAFTPHTTHLFSKRRERKWWKKIKKNKVGYCTREKSIV